MTRIVLTLMLVLVALPAAADVLLIEQVRQAEALTVPVNGQTMSEVESIFGAPDNKTGAVGDPPITRWNYPRWSVYFEYDRVLFTVLNEGEVVGSPAESS